MKKKKNKTIISFIMGIALAIITFIGVDSADSFAKYVTGDSASATASVAKWGFVVDVEASKLFGKNYKNGVVAESTETNLSVQASASTNTDIIAPGTRGEMTISISGSAEVRSLLTITTASEDIYLKVLDSGEVVDEYYPLAWFVEGAETLDPQSSPFDSIADAFTAIKTDLGMAEGQDSIEIAPGTVINKKYTIRWFWPFNGMNENTDEYDTLLGIYSGSSDHVGLTQYEFNTTLELSCDISISQIV